MKLSGMLTYVYTFIIFIYNFHRKDRSSSILNSHSCSSVQRLAAEADGSETAAQLNVVNRLCSCSHKFPCSAQRVQLQRVLHLFG